MDFSTGDESFVISPLVMPLVQDVSIEGPQNVSTRQNTAFHICKWLDAARIDQSYAMLLPGRNDIIMIWMQRE